MGIESRITNELGYEPIRDKKEKVKTSADLHNHLGKMNGRVMERKSDLYRTTFFALISYVNYLENQLNTRDNIISKMKPKVDIIEDYFKSIIDEESKKEKAPEANIKKKGILERIFGN